MEEIKEKRGVKKMKGIRILVAEDEDKLREIVLKYLHKEVKKLCQIVPTGTPKEV